MFTRTATDTDLDTHTETVTDTHIPHTRAGTPHRHKLQQAHSNTQNTSKHFSP